MSSRYFTPNTDNINDLSLEDFLEFSENQFSPPWAGVTNERLYTTESEVFFPSYSIDPLKWNRFYPYRLMVVDIANNNQPAEDGGVTVTNTGTQITPSEKGIEYIITQEARRNAWEMVLPITPQQLQITDEFAINTSATMRGIVEEHNGVKFKTITATGTTGVWPKKPTNGDDFQRPGTLGAVFGGTIENANNVLNQAQGIKSAFNGKHPFNPPRTRKPGEVPGAGLETTGYYQALYLGQFLERYAQLKKNPVARSYRLVLDMPKVGQSFIVTPVRFSLTKSEQRPNEFIYNMQFRAWKRINLNEDVAAASTELPDLGDSSTFRNIINGIEQTRRTLGAASNLVKAVRSDFRGVFENLRQASLVVKDTADVIFSVIDLPNQIIKDLDSAIEDAVTNTLDAFTPPTDRFRSQSGIEGSVNKFLDTAGLSGPSKAGAVARSIQNQREVNEGLSRAAVQAGALGKEASDRTGVDTLNNVFDNPEENFDFFNTLNVDDLELAPEQQVAIEDEIERARLTTIDDFREIKADLIDLSNQIANNYGALDPTYARIYGRQEPKTRALDLTIEENEVLLSIFETIQALDLLTATKQFNDLKTEDSLEFVGGLAAESDVEFEGFPSKTLAPVPFGLTIEEIAARYMGDADKWLELVTVNKLRSPYIDEVGFVYDLLSNAEGRQFNVNDSEQRLFIGQQVTLFSDTVPAFVRRITNVERIGPNNFVVTVDGLSNLGSLTTVNNAKVQAYSPGTINSQNQIYIPVNQPSDADDRVFEIPNVSDTNLAQVSKVDFLLDGNFDVAINSVGDLRLASGLNNLIQALKLKIRTKKGTLLQHLNYGLGLEHGISVADIENGVIIQEMNKMVREDPRFESITKIEIRLVGSTLAIEMTIKLANNSGVIPINFNVRVS